MVEMNKLKLAKVNHVSAKEKENTLEFDLGSEGSNLSVNGEGKRRRASRFSNMAEGRVRSIE